MEASLSSWLDVAATVYVTTGVVGVHTTWFRLNTEYGEVDGSIVSSKGNSVIDVEVHRMSNSSLPIFNEPPMYMDMGTGIRTPYAYPGGIPVVYE